jgi:hypothetical protein
VDVGQPISPTSAFFIRNNLSNALIILRNFLFVPIDLICRDINGQGVISTTSHPGHCLSKIDIKLIAQQLIAFKPMNVLQ